MPEVGFKELFELFERFFESERFSGMSSPVHRLDPRVKILASVALILSAISVDGFTYILLLACAVSILLFASKLPKIAFLFRSLPFTIFSSLVVSPIPFVTPGIPAAIIQVSLITLTPTFEGVYRAVTFVFRVWVCIASALLLTFTTRFPDIMAGLRRLGVPSLLSSMILITYRYAFLFADEALKMLQAKELRTFRKEGFLERVRGIGRITGCLFVRAYEKGEETYYAMILRGFQGGEIPLNAKLKLGLSDIIFVVAVAAFCFTVVLLGWGGPSILAFWLPLFRVVLVETPLRWLMFILPLPGGLVVA
ncbi:MAG: cobalt ECF transporter T component CbiQ [Candidatus Jordarchaeales archaeon]